MKSGSAAGSGRRQLSARLKERRETIGISLSEASKRSGIPTKKLQEFECGASLPGPQDIEPLLVRALKYDPSYADRVARSIQFILNAEAKLGGESVAQPAAGSGRRQAPEGPPLNRDMARAMALVYPTRPAAGHPGRARGRAAAANAGIFISYRRSDQAALAGRLYDKLAAKFGESQVFIDVGSIEPGLDFRQVLEQALSRCKVLIAVIGKDWVTATDSDGGLRLDDPDDLVRLELETALKRNIRVIPVLVDGTPMPRKTCMPTALESFALRNAFPVWNVHFNSNMQQLIATLERVLDPK